jgi:glucose/arabinose dehydrogenase
MQRVLASVVIASIAFGAAAAQVAAPAPTAPAAKTEGAPPVPAAPQRAPAASRPQPTLLGDGPWDVATEQQKIHVTVVTKGLDHPWGLAFVPNGDMLVTERDGRLRVIRKGVLDPTPIAGLPDILRGGLGGLMDIALHPNFARNRLIYLTYAKPGAQVRDQSTLAVMRARWDGSTTLTDVRDIFVADAWYGAAPLPKRCCGQGPASGSYGSRIAFDRKGYLFITSGDRNYGERVQDPSNHFGKILRLKDDGSVPKDNPFVGKPGYKPEIWSTGHRNPLGLFFHPKTGELWETEFGPRGGDELNVIERGKNYGWIDVTQGAHYNGEPAKGVKGVPGMQDPVIAWVPSINPGNLVFYTGNRFPGWKGDMLMPDMTRSLLRVRFDGKRVAVAQERMLTDLKQRMRDIRIGPDGDIYVLTDETAGAVLRISPGK